MKYERYIELIESFGLIKNKKGDDAGFVYQENGYVRAICGFRNYKKWPKKELLNETTTKSGIKFNPKHNWNKGSLILYDYIPHGRFDGNWSANYKVAKKMLAERIEKIKKNKLIIKLNRLKDDF